MTKLTKALFKPVSWKKVLDSLCSEIVRRRAIIRVGGCERCGAKKHDTQKDNGEIYEAYKYLQWSHIIPRTNLKVRYDLFNSAGLCAGCHFHIDNDFQAKMEFALEYLGQSEYDMLRARSLTRAKVDYNLIYLYLKEELKKVGG